MALVIGALSLVGLLVAFVIFANPNYSLPESKLPLAILFVIATMFGAYAASEGGKAIGGLLRRLFVSSSGK